MFKDLQDLNRKEDEILVRFENSLKHISEMPLQRFKAALFQKRIHSHAFTPLYDLAIDWLSDRSCKFLLGHLIREEYPSDGRSHRELLIDDLQIAGFQKEEILETKSSEETERSIQLIRSIITERKHQNHDLVIVAAIRFWGELLASIEYGVLFQRLNRIGLCKEESTFFWPHHLHDMKGHPLSHETITSDKLKGQIFDSRENAKLCLHGELLSRGLVGLIKSDDDFRVIAQIEEEVVAIKDGFWEQFIQ